jgi:hypothetical protein
MEYLILVAVVSMGGAVRANYTGLFETARMVTANRK